MMLLPDQETGMVLSGAGGKERYRILRLREAWSLRREWGPSSGKLPVERAETETTGRRERGVKTGGTSFAPKSYSRDMGRGVRRPFALRVPHGPLYATSGRPVFARHPLFSSSLLFDGFDTVVEGLSIVREGVGVQPMQPGLHQSVDV